MLLSGLTSRPQGMRLGVEVPREGRRSVSGSDSGDILEFFVKNCTKVLGKVFKVRTERRRTGRR